MFISADIICHFEAEVEDFMVYHILELYLKQKEDYRKRSIQAANVKYNLIATYICLIIFSVLGIVNLFIEIPGFLIIEFIIFALLFILIFIIERKNIKKSKDRIKTFDEFLSELQKKLIINGVNWNEDKRLDYLIGECDNMINAKSKERKKIIRYAEIIVLPVAKFIAEIVKDKVGMVSTVEVIAIIIVILLSAFAFFVFINSIAVVIDLLLKTGSISEMKNLRNTLMDIKVRGSAAN